MPKATPGEDSWVRFTEAAFPLLGTSPLPFPMYSSIHAHDCLLSDYCMPDAAGTPCGGHSGAGESDRKAGDELQCNYINAFSHKEAGSAC